uniref:Putative secreted protein n=1 Tax=Ixodes ricinus TaxID=34613 RepID=A0A6B0ULA6_IXORI
MSLLRFGLVLRFMQNCSAAWSTISLLTQCSSDEMKPSSRSLLAMPGPEPAEASSSGASISCSNVSVRSFSSVLLASDLPSLSSSISRMPSISSFCRSSSRDTSAGSSNTVTLLVA